MKSLPRSKYISLGAITVIALLVFAYGPSLSVGGSSPLSSLTNRLIAMLVLPGLWLIASFVQNGATRYLNAKVSSALNKAGINAPKVVSTDKQGDRDDARPPGSDSAEVDHPNGSGVVAGRFKAAMGVLKKRNMSGARRRRWLYQLPWYVVIGAPDSGKTTAIANSGLNFPLRKAGSSAMATTGTRDCEWWFTDEAVLIDTAGRYTQHLKGGTDKSEWIGFLKLLRRHRRRQPLNGIFVTVCIKQLLSATEELRLQHAGLVRARIAEIYRELRLRVPVYVLFTKSDLIAGFVEYFDDLGREGREAVWGITFPFSEEEPIPDPGQYEIEYSALVARLDERLFERVQQEGDLQRRALVFGFPQQVASFKEPTAQFVREVFDANTFETPVLLRGAYFVSSTQREAPLDPVMDAMSRTFGMTPGRQPLFGGKGRSYFLSRFLREVAFVEAWIVDSDKRLAEQLRRARLAILLAAATAIVVFGAVEVYGYARDKAAFFSIGNALDDYDRKAGDLGLERVSDGDLRRVAPLLDQMQQLRDQCAHLDAASSWFDFVGYRQTARLGAELDRTYAHLLENALLPRLILRLEGEMRAHRDDAAFLEPTLEVYLVLGNQGPAEPNLVEHWMQAEWAQDYAGPGDAGLRTSLAHHLDILLRRPFEQFELDPALIDHVRSVLRKVSPAQQVVDDIAGSPEAGALPFWSIADHAGPLAESVLRTRSNAKLAEGVEGLYTREGFFKVFRSQLARAADRVAARGWLLGIGAPGRSGAEASDDLQREATGIYLQSVALKWDHLINDVAVKPVSSMEEALRTLNVLSAPYSPIRLLVSSAAEDTTLGAAPNAKPNTPAPPKPDAFMALFRPADGDAIAAMAGRYTDEHFRSLHDLMRVPLNSGPNAHPPIDNAISELEGLYRSLTPEASPQEGPLQQTGQSAGAIARVQAEAAHLPQPIKQWMLGISEKTSDLSIDRAKTNLEALWDNGAGRLCREVTNSRYPFAANGNQDATLGDFGRLFSTGGAIDSFFAKNLAPYVDTTHEKWRLAATGTSQPPISDAALQQFQRAAMVRDGMFSEGGSLPSVDFEVSVASLDQGSQSVTVAISGQQLTFAHDTPTATMRMRWPASSASEDASITFAPGLFQSPVAISASGPWAFFRLLQRASVHRSANGDEVTARFSTQGHSADIRLHADSIVNPLDGHMLSRFHCPSSL